MVRRVATPNKSNIKVGSPTCIRDFSFLYTKLEVMDIFYQVLQNCQSGEKENTKLHVACIGLSPLVVQSNMQVLNAFLLYREKVRGKGIEDAVVRDDVYSFLKALVDYGAGKGKFTNEMRRMLKSVYKRDFGGFLSDNDYQIGVILGPRTITKTHYDSIVEVLMRYGTQKGVVWQAGEMNLMKRNIANSQLFSSAVFSGRGPPICIDNAAG